MGTTTLSLSGFPVLAAPAMPAPQPAPAMPCHRPGLTIRRGLRIARRPADSYTGCLRLAGQLAQICAELEQLAVLETH